MDLDEYKHRRNARAAVVFFTAPWCGPCKSLYPLFNDMKKNAHRDIKMFYVDVRDSPDVSDYCDIRSMPTFRFYFEGRLLQDLTFTGANEEKLVYGYNQLIKMLPDD